ncbi:MAG TPA: glycoside hydrolase family 2 TIM barrel-domain containing protein [Actinomycetota bacterium]|jgi:beta-mannosidase
MISLHEGRARLSLDGVWKYRIEDDEPGEPLGYPNPDLDDSSWRDMELPTNWYLTEVGDFFGTIWFRRSFRVPPAFEGQRVFLRFGAVDYVADVWLNSAYLGSHEGMFNPFEFDVTDRLDYDGTNVVVVKDGAPKDDTEYVQVDFSDNPLSTPYRTHQAKAIGQIKGHMIDAMHRPGAMTSFRSDGNSGGIWDSVELIARPSVYVDHVKIFTRIGVKKDWLGDRLDKPDGTGIVSVDVTMQNTTGEVVETDLRLRVEPHTFEDAGHERSRRVVLQPGRTTHELVLTVPDARFWWTWDLGEPNLYTATVGMHEDSVAQTFGIKEVVRDEQNGQWLLNGTRIFLRGMRYISSLWMSEANERQWSEDLSMMREVEINAIRIGSHVEKDGFYTFCDRMGFLVWQVFPLHYCVGDTDDLIERATEMIKDMGLMLCNHASIGMWSVFKEPEVYLLPDKPNNYHRLCPILKEALGTVDPVRWIHLGDYREGVLNLMIGYCWDGDTDLNRVTLEPNIVEFGAGSIPVRETLETFIPRDKLWPPDWDAWEYHGFFYNLAFGYAKVQMTDSLEEFIEHYQDYEALVVKEQIEYLRRRKYRPVASMYHYYWSDPCPIMGSGLFDYYRRPYRVYEAMKAVYGRVLISLERDASPYVIGREKVYEPGTTFSATVWVTNDHPRPFEEAQVSWDLANKDTGEVMSKNALTATLPADSAEEVDRIDWPIPTTARPGAYRVNMHVLGSDGQTLSTNATDLTVAVIRRRP